MRSLKNDRNSFQTLWQTSRKLLSYNSVRSPFPDGKSDDAIERPSLGTAANREGESASTLIPSANNGQQFHGKEGKPQLPRRRFESATRLPPTKTGLGQRFGCEEEAEEGEKVGFAYIQKPRSSKVGPSRTTFSSAYTVVAEDERARVLPLEETPAECFARVLWSVFFRFFFLFFLFRTCGSDRCLSSYVIAFPNCR